MIPTGKMKTAVNLDQLAARLLEARGKRVLLLPHVGADGDAIGSALALRRLLNKAGVSADVLVDEPVPEVLHFIPESAAIVQVTDAADHDPTAYDFSLLVDCHESDRIGRRAPLFEATEGRGSLDHHVYQIEPGDFDVIDPTKSSTSEMVYLLLKVFETMTGETFLDAIMANQMASGIVSDTGRFSYSNATPGTFRVTAELVDHGADLVTASYELFDRISLNALRMKGLVLARAKSHADGLILVSTIPQKLIDVCNSSDYDLNTIPSELRNVSDVAVVFLIRETTEAGVIRVNIRSDERLNAAHLANRFGGGGHARAAGLTLRNLTLEQAAEQLIDAAMKELASEHGD